MTTKLAAIQRIAAQMGLQRPAATDTGNPTDAGKIESILDEVSRSMQGDGFSCNRLLDYDIALPTKKIEVSGGSGTFTFGETITETTSGATGVFNRIDDLATDLIHIAPVSGTFTGGQTLTGGTSNATRTGATLTTLTSNYIGIPSSWIMVSSGSTESKILSNQGLFLYDQAENTTTFTAAVTVHAVAELSFANLPDHWAEAVIWQTALQACRAFKRSPSDEQVMAMQAAKFKAIAANRDMIQGPFTIFDNPSSRRISGKRTSTDPRFV